MNRVNEHKSKWMKEPQCYMMLKDKLDGITFGSFSYPKLFGGTVYLLPKEDGDKLVQDGWAKAAKPDNDNKESTYGY